MIKRPASTFTAAFLSLAAIACLLHGFYAIEALRRAPVLHHPLADSIAYVAWAKAVAGGALLQADPFYRAPLYPYLIAPLYALEAHPETWIVLLQALAGCVTILLVGGMARRLYGPLAGIVAMLGIGLFGPLAAQETKILPTSLAILLEAWALAQLLRARDRRGRFGAGMLAGACAIAQPSALVIWIGSIALHARRATLRTGALPIVLGGALVIAPVTIHNLRAGDLVLISSNGGMTFYHGNNETSRYGLLEPPARAGHGGDAVSQARLDNEIASAEEGRRLSASGSSRHWFEQGMRALAADPGRAAALLGQKLVRSLGPHEYADNYSYAVERHGNRVLALFWVAFPLLFAAAGAGLVLRGPRGRDEWSLVLFASIGILTCLVFFVGSRYRCMSVPAMAILAGRAVTLFPSATPRRRLTAAIVCAAVAAVSLIPPGRAAATQDSLAAAQWAAALERDDRSAEAWHLYQWAAGLDPTNEAAFGRWAAITQARDGSPAAIRILDSGIQGGADGALLRRERGTARIAAGDFAGAEEDLRLANRANPADATAALNLAACLVRRGADAEASALLAARDLAMDPVALYYRGLIDLRAGRWTGAAARFDSSRSAGAGDPRPTILRALALLRSGDEAGARGLLARWIEGEGIADPGALTERVLGALRGTTRRTGSGPDSEDAIWRAVDAALSAITIIPHP